MTNGDSGSLARTRALEQQLTMASLPYVRETYEAPVRNAFTAFIQMSQLQMDRQQVRSQLATEILRRQELTTRISMMEREDALRRRLLETRILEQEARANALRLDAETRRIRAQASRFERIPAYVPIPGEGGKMRYIHSSGKLGEVGEIKIPEKNQKRARALYEDWVRNRRYRARSEPELNVGRIQAIIKNFETRKLDFEEGSPEHEEIQKMIQWWEDRLRLISGGALKKVKEKESELTDEELDARLDALIKKYQARK